jgi:epoxyqueuosine reductase QueG
MMMNLTGQVKEKALELGADFVGIANRERFAGVPARADPANIMPDYQSIVVFGISMSIGCLEAWFSKRSRRPQDDYDLRATEGLDDISYSLTRFLERQGHPSCYFKQNDSYNYYDGLKSDFSHKHAALAAGVGVLGLSSLLMHPRYGAAVHLSSLITKAYLEADPMIDVDTDNPCDDCGYCVQICPVNAIDPEVSTAFTLNGKEYQHSKPHKIKCFYGCDGYTGTEYQIGKKEVGTWSYNDHPISNTKEAIEIITAPDNEVRHPMELAEKLIDPALQYCGNCHKICVGNRKERDALFKMHLHSGTVKIPESPSMLVHLRDSNHRLIPYKLEDSGYALGDIEPNWDED